MDERMKVQGQVQATTGRLTPRMREVAELIAQGMTNREIGLRLGIQPATVRNHIVRLSERLQIQGGQGNRVRVIVTRFIVEEGSNE